MSIRGTSRGSGRECDGVAVGANAPGLGISRGSSLGSGRGSGLGSGRGSSLGQQSSDGATSSRVVLGALENSSSKRSSDGATSSHVVWGQVENSSSSNLDESNSDDSNKAARTSMEENARRAKMEELEVLTVSDCTSSGDLSARHMLVPSGYESTGDTGEACVDERAVLAPEVIQEMERLRTLSREELNRVVPREEEGDLTSIGSIGHHMDSCSPCAFTTRSRGCKQGIFCGFCHFTHSEVDMKKNRRRPCKAQRMKLKKMVTRLKSQVTDNPENFDPETVHLPPSIAENKNKKEKMVAMLKEHQFTTQALNVVDKYNEDKVKGKMSL